MNHEYDFFTSSYIFIINLANCPTLITIQVDTHENHFLNSIFRIVQIQIIKLGTSSSCAECRTGRLIGTQPGQCKINYKTS